MTKSVKHLNAVIEKLEDKVKHLQDMFDNLLDIKVKELEDRESELELKMEMLIRELQKSVNTKKDKRKEIQCRVCKQTFESRNRLRDHVLTDHPTTPKCTSFGRRNEDNESKDNSVKSNQYLVKCNLCTKRFKDVSNLERHIKRDHEDHETFECDFCRKTFVTKWRLDKHVKMHSIINLKECNYFRNKRQCPFEDLGCKFGHGTDFQREATDRQIGDISEQSNETNDKTFDYEGDMLENSSFCTSTPLKKKKILLKCEECPNLTQCTDCLIKQHMQERYEGNMTS